MEFPENYEKLFAGKKITVMGLGVLGRAAGDAEFLALCGAQVTVTDLKSEDKLTSSVERLKQYPNITFHLGGHIEEDFTSADMVLKAAGVPIRSEFIEAAQRAGVPVFMSTAIFAKYAQLRGVKVVGVTGTRGKSTTTAMISHSLISAYAKASSDKRAFVGGNIRGISTLAMLPEIREGDVVVLELDSWQLQGFGDLGISPNFSVFTNLMPDHQNYYPDMKAYFADKAKIFLHQKDGDALFIGVGIEESVRAAHPPVEPTVIGSLPKDWELKVPGDHNRANAAAAAAVLLALGLTTDKIKEGLETFESVEGRLQFIGIFKGVKVYNDNNATTPEATLAALKALDVGQRNIVLIAGGADKGLGLDALATEIQKTCKAVFLLAGTGTDRIKPMLGDPQVFHSMETVVDSAFEAIEFGDILLFSPAFASFGIFQNEYERNDQFLHFVKKVI